MDSEYQETLDKIKQLIEKNEQLEKENSKLREENKILWRHKIDDIITISALINIKE